MVYDDRGSYVGDMHWRRDYDFGEGEEVELERGGVIVQVQDLVHCTEQDLSELIDKRAKEKEQRQLQAVARARGPTSVLPQSMPQATPRPIPSDHFQLRHRPLHQLIGTPTGQHGRALVPQESPYELRQQNADSPDDRAAKRRKYEDERPAKKGHAQALFGQTLTLSATPLSSTPARYRPRQESSSSISVDDETRDTGPYLENALREQPKSSFSFNHRKGDATSKLKATKKILSGCTTDQSHSLALDPHLKRATIPADAETIDVEDPDPPSSSDPPIAMLEHVEKRTGKTAAKADTRSKPSLSRQALDRSVLPRSLPTTVEKKRAHRIEEARQSRKSSLAVTGSVDSEALARGTSDTPGSNETARKLDRPRTELRLKSMKRRGLLMMSDRPKGPVRPLSSGITSAASTTCEDVDQVAVADRAQPTPPSNPGGKDKVSINGEPSTAFDTSFELGEDEDTFRSPSPRTQERSRHSNSRPDLEDNERAEGIQLLQQEEDLDTHFEAYPLMEAEESIIRPSEVLKQTKAPASSPQGHIYDPYRLPSPSTEKESQAAPEQVLVSPRKAEMNTEDNNLPADTHIDDEETSRPGDKATTGTGRNRKTRRNIVLDDDEESETLCEATEGVESIGGKDIASHSNQDDVPPIRAKSPANTARCRKRKSSMENEEPELEVDEDLATKRRVTTRKTRRRRVASESPPGSSEDESEREQPVKNRRKKATQAFEERPRLTKLKRSVKSRELVGFDLSALKVPLGPRGIGLPFSILSSPADAPIQSIASQNATKPEPYLQTEVDDDGLQMQPDASKARVPIRETSEVCSSILGSTNVDESQSDQAKPTSETVAEPRCTTESHSPEQNVERPQQESSLSNSGSFEKQDVTPVAHEKRPSKENFDTYQLQDARVADTLSGECPEDDIPLLVDVSMPCQGGAPGVAKESSSVMQASNPCEKRSVNQQPPAQAPQCETSIIESETKVCAENDVLSTAKTISQDTASSLSRGNSKISEPAATVSKAPASDGCDQLEVEKAPPAAAGGPHPRRTVGLRRTASAVRSINNLQIETTTPAEAPIGTTAAESSTKPVARIANPATRGRKAALKSHAAGQAPQRILPPTQPLLLIPISTADLAMTPMEEPKKEPERPKKKMQFPGFQSARGEGPWSREAFDLLESGRPA